MAPKKNSTAAAKAAEPKAGVSAPDAKKPRTEEKHEEPKKTAEPEVPKEEPKEVAEPEVAKEEPSKAAQPELAKEGDEASEKKEPETPKELEEDAPADSRTRISSSVAMSDFDSTQDAVVSHGGSLVYGMCSGGFQHLFTCSRATLGLKGGRYLFEFRVVETFGLQEEIRVGFSTAGSSLFLAETDASFGFSSVGDFFHGKKRTEKACPVSWSKGAVFGVLLNLVEGAPNGLTISLFKGGRRVSQPFPVPESFKGKALYPSLTFKNVTLAVDFVGSGGKPTKTLPFAVRMLQDAAAEDAATNPSTAPSTPEAVFPIALPDAGLFDYVDQLLEKEGNKVVELSDRAFVQWASKSANKQSASGGKHASSNDRPFIGFGNELDQPATRKTLKMLAPFTGRNVVVAEVLGNLTKASRAESLAHFKGRHRCVARVLMGKPPADMVAAVHARLLQEKEEQREQAIAKKRHAFAQKARLKKAEAARQLRLKAAQKKREAKKEGKDEPQEVGKEEEEAKDEGPGEVFDADNEGSEHYVPPASLTDEEKTLLFAKRPLPDVAEKLVASKYTNFELPDAEEGFDSIEYMWEPREACATILSKYISEKKLSTPIEDLKPSEWFTERLKAFEAAKKNMRAKATAHKASKKDDTPKEGEDTEKPPCLDFSFEDWALLTIRFELFLLAHAFKMDVNDPERPALPLNHLEFYYQKYFNKPFTAANFTCAAAKELIENLLGSDAVKVGEKEVLEPTLPGDAEVADFVKLTDGLRLDRERRADAGDESAVLKFPRTGGSKGSGAKGGGGKGGDKGGGSKGGEKGAEKGRNQDNTRKGGGAKGGGGKRGDKGRDWKTSTKGSGGKGLKPTSSTRPAIGYAPPHRRTVGAQGFQRDRAAPVRPWLQGGDRGVKRPMASSTGQYAKQQRRW